MVPVVQASTAVVALSFHLSDDIKTILHDPAGAPEQVGSWNPRTNSSRGNSRESPLGSGENHRRHLDFSVIFYIAMAIAATDAPASCIVDLAHPPLRLGQPSETSCTLSLMHNNAWNV